jgi:signal transduction histidine kinase
LGIPVKDKIFGVADRVSSHYAFNPWLSAWSAPPMIVGLVLAELPYGHGADHLILTAIAATLGHGVFALLQELWRRMGAPWPGPVWRRVVTVVALLLVGSQARIGAVLVCFALWEMPNAVATSTRMFNSALILVVGGLIGGVAMKTLAQYRELRRELLAALVEGEKALEAQSVMVERLREDVLRSVDDQVRITQEQAAEDLRGLEDAVREGMSDHHQVEKLLLNTDAGWRQLSHELWERGKVSEPKPGWVELFAVASRSRSFHPLLLPLAMAIMFQLVFSRLYPTSEAVLWMVVWGIGALGFNSALNELSRLTKARIWLFPLTVGAFFISGLALFALPDSTPAQNAGAFINHLGVVLVMTFFGLLTGVFKDRRAILDYLSTLVDKATFKRLAAESEFSALARQISSELHSTLRATFLAGMLRIQKNLDEAKHLEALSEISRLRQEVAHPVSSRSADGAPPGLVDFLGTWVGLLEITTNIDDVSIPDYLEEPISKVVRNAVNDAVRHGGAERVSVTLTPSDTELTVTIVNDGSPFNPDARLGLGSITLDRLATAGWSRNPGNGDGTTLVASFALTLEL